MKKPNGKSLVPTYEQVLEGIVEKPLPKIGAPTLFNDEIADEICQRMINGESLRKISEQKHLPHKNTILRWAHNNESFRDQYSRALALQAHSNADEVIDIARTEPDNQRARNIIDAIKWQTGKRLPKVYGDSSLIKHADADGGKLTLATITGELAD